MVLFSQVSKYRTILDRISSLKIEMYIDHCLGSNNKSQLDILLEEFLMEKMNNEVVVGYFLSLTNYKLHLQGNQMNISAEIFASFRAKFMLILSSIMLKQLDIMYMGILIHNASRICFDVFF